ncbi:MAG TPA: response regulator [Sulfuricurvum sp.]|nr:response regulator [Sulfuricurvum sp.]
MFLLNDLTLLYLQNDPLTLKNTLSFMHKNGLKVFESDHVKAACDLFQHHKIDLLMVDLDLKDENGLEFIRLLRQKEIFTPAIIAAADVDKEKLLEALNLDISHCLIKPYTQEELLNALHIAAKKVHICHPVSYAELDHGFSYDPINKVINSPDGTTIKLCKKEHLLIELLLQNSHQIITYDIIEAIVWKEDLMSIDSLRTLVRGIRKKTYPDIITNHNGVGYKITV